MIDDPSMHHSIPTWRWIDCTLRSWALAEMSTWSTIQLSQNPGLVNFEDEISAVNVKFEHIFVFDVHPNHVSVRPKPGVYSAENMHDGTIPEIGRMLHYRHYILEVIGKHATTLNWTLVLDVSDGSSICCNFPLFAFQKQTNSSNLLLPDPEFFYHQYYETPHYTDDLSYGDKANKAIFVGSTTGGGIMTLSSVRSLEAPRLRTGVAFRKHADIDFRLPGIVQCETREVEAAIRELGFGIGAADWQKQFQFKLLISMDGNGATCSRLAIGLKSNSIVLKYDSNSVLYYSHGLRPWLHYIPIKIDEDVVAVVASLKADSDRYAFIAQASQKFYNTYLTKSALLDYGGALFGLYADKFGKPQPSD